MNILLKFPTRQRPKQAVEIVQKYASMSNQPRKIGMVMSCDDDDTTMNRNILIEEIQGIGRKSYAYFEMFFGQNKTKIQACNADIEKVNWNWDIIVLVSDDMIPQVKGYDDVIRNYMIAKPGILWFNDGCQGEKLNTLTIYSRKVYNDFGYLYHPKYKSFYCDTELTDLCRTTLKDITTYIPYCIIRHEHPGTGYAEKMDALYQKNQRFWADDMETYIFRKNYEYDWSLLILTIPGREQKLANLLKTIHEKAKRICPKLKYEIKLGFDNREKSVGEKRQLLLDAALGKYMCFIDDDDDITDEYLQDLWACIQGNFYTMRIYGQVAGHKFFHSIDIKLSDKMAVGEVFQRPPNHLNPMFSDIAKLVPFKSISHGEDLDWAIRLNRHGFLKNEYKSDPSRIHYIYNSRSAVDGDTLKHQQNTTYDTVINCSFVPPAVAEKIEKIEKPEKRQLKLGRNGFVSK